MLIRSLRVMELIARDAAITALQLTSWWCLRLILRLERVSPS